MKKYILIIVCLLLITSCSSTKKQKNTEINKTEESAKVDSSASSIKKVEETKASEINSEVNSVEETNKIDLKNGESITVTEFDAKGNIKSKKKYEGSGSIENKKSTKKETLKETLNTKTKAVDKSKLDYSKRTHASTKAVKKAVNIQRKGFSFFDYLFWIILIIVLIIIVIILRYLNKRFKLFSVIKKHVLNVFSDQDKLA